MSSIISRVKNLYSDSILIDHEDDMIIDAILPVILATRHIRMSEPIWMMIVGPPSCGKTEMIRCFEGNPLFVFSDANTENALASGYTDKETKEDPSLLAKLDEKILTYRDLTSMMDENEKILDKTLSILRAVFDGTFCKHSGKEGSKNYKAHFGILACTTDIIDAFTERHSQLGQRFMMFRIGRMHRTLNERINRIGTIMSFVSDGERAEKRKRLKEGMKYFIQEINDLGRSGVLPSYPEELKRETCILGDMLARMRTSAVGEEIVVTAESGVRVTQTLAEVAMCRALLDGRDVVDETDIRLLKRLTLDTLDTPRLRALHTLYTTGGPGRILGKSLNSIQDLLGMSRNRVHKILAQFHHTGITNMERDGKSMITKLTQEFYGTLESTELFDGDHMPTIEIKRSQ